MSVFTSSYQVPLRFLADQSSRYSKDKEINVDNREIQINYFMKLPDVEFLYQLRSEIIVSPVFIENGIFGLNFTEAFNEIGS